MTSAQGDPIIQLAAPQRSPSRDSKGFSDERSFVNCTFYSAA